MVFDLSFVVGVYPFVLCQPKNMDNVLADRRVQQNQLLEAIRDLRAGNRKDAQLLAASRQSLSRTGPIQPSLRVSPERFVPNVSESANVASIVLRRENERLQQLQHALGQRQHILADATARLEEKRQTVLQVEASLVELQQENELTERGLDEREARSMETSKRISELERRTTEEQQQQQEQLRTIREEHERRHMELETQWRVLEEMIEKASQNASLEEQRLKRREAQLDEKDTKVRDRQQELNAAEQLLLQRRRKTATRKQTCGAISRAALERMCSELKEREALLHE